MKNCIFLMLILCMSSCLDKVSSTELEEKKEAYFNYAKEQGVHEYMNYTADFPVGISEEDWKKFVDNYVALKKAEAENVQENIERSKVRNNFRKKIKEANSQEEIKTIQLEYSSKYDWIHGPEEYQEPIEG